LKISHAVDASGAPIWSDVHPPARLVAALILAPAG